MCQRSPKLTIRRRLTHRSQEFHFDSRLRTNITRLSLLLIFCVRSNANAPGVTCLTVTGPKTQDLAILKHILGLVCVNSRAGNTEDW